MTKSKHDPDGSKLKALLKRDAHLRSKEIKTFPIQHDLDADYAKIRDSEWDKSFIF